MKKEIDKISISKGKKLLSSEVKREEEKNKLVKPIWRFQVLPENMISSKKANKAISIQKLKVLDEILRIKVLELKQLNEKSVDIKDLDELFYERFLEELGDVAGTKSFYELWSVGFGKALNLVVQNLSNYRETYLICKANIGR